MPVKRVAQITGEEPLVKNETPVTEQSETYEQWFEKQPKAFRDRFEQEAYDRNARGLSEFYGPEIGQLLDEIRENPDLKKHVARMTDKQYREWVAQTVEPIYDDPRYRPQNNGNGGGAAVDQNFTKIEKKVDDIDKRLADADIDRQRREYTAQRKTEYQALINTFPELQWSDQNSPQYRRLEAIIEYAEDQSVKTNKVVSYADSYQRFKNMWEDQEREPAPRPVPAQQSKSEPSKPQAPRTKVEARDRMMATLNKHGGLAALSAALRK